VQSGLKVCASLVFPVISEPVLMTNSTRSGETFCASWPTTVHPVGRGAEIHFLDLVGHLGGAPEEDAPVLISGGPKRPPPSGHDEALPPSGSEYGRLCVL